MNSSHETSNIPPILHMIASNNFFPHFFYTGTELYHQSVSKFMKKPKPENAKWECLKLVTTQFYTSSIVKHLYKINIYHVRNSKSPLSLQLCQASSSILRILIVCLLSTHPLSQNFSNINLDHISTVHSIPFLPQPIQLSKMLNIVPFYLYV